MVGADTESVLLRPIGVVRNAVAGDKADGWETVTSQLVLRAEYTEALSGLADFSHVEVVLYFHRAAAPAAAKIHPRGRDDLPLVGYFATRSPHRPNPIGVSAARLIAIEGSVLTVEGLDAFDGTPILDIKPYLPRPDLVQSARVPDWLAKAQRAPHGP